MRDILIDLERLRYPYSGLGQYCHYLYKGLQEVASGEISLDFYGCSTEQHQCRHSFCYLHRCWMPFASDYKLIHITHQRQKYISPSKKNKVILTLHDLNFLHETLGQRRQARAYKYAKRNLERADAIVCISHFVKEDLAKHIGLFKLKPQAMISVIHNGIASTPAPTLPKHLGLSRPYLLSIGTLDPKKNQHLTVEMLSLLPEDLDLVLVHTGGRKAYTDIVYNMVSSLGLEHRVHHLSKVSEEDKNALIAHCHGYIHPSIAEGFGIPPIEAMLYGRPVFLSKETSLPEIGGSQAYYFDALEPKAMAVCVHQGLQDFHQDPTKPQKLKDWASQYNYTRMASQYYALYQELLMQP